jgi:hypothetical protein
VRENSPYEDLPEPVRVSFANCSLLSLRKTAALLNMDRKTLRRMLDRGDITARQKGYGLKKPRIVFTIADVAGYLRTTFKSRDSELLVRLRNMPYSAPRKGTMNVSWVRPRRKKIKLEPKKSDGDLKEA